MNRYPALNDLPDDGSTHVVAANRRLARSLRQAWADRQSGTGRTAWRTPAVYSLADWYLVLADNFDTGDGVPARINEQQSRVAWERCLRAEIDDHFVRFPALARSCREAWQRLHEWRVPFAEVRNAARGQDQRWFVLAAERYRELLRSNDWLDSASLPEWLAECVPRRQANMPGEVRITGFDRMSPQLEHLLDALGRAGTAVRTFDLPAGFPERLLRFPSIESELRGAGAWARQQLLRNHECRPAVVVTGLEQETERKAALIREGLVPGWQYADARVGAAAEISYGRRLADYPAVHSAVLALRWLYFDLGGTDTGLLLRSPYFGAASQSGRHRLERKLRDEPDRDWSRARWLAATERYADADAVDWITRLQRVETVVASVPDQERPGRWAELFDRALDVLGWPGAAPLTSTDFQLRNRWRKLLNEFARLEIVVPSMTGGEAVTRLAAMASDVVYQPETEGGVVHVVGPLEIAGLDVDAVWLTGATASHWPAPCKPLPLVSRDLQRRYGMPDSSPEVALAHARRVLCRIAGAAPGTTFSYAALVDDAEQLPTALLDGQKATPSEEEPGWFAAKLCTPAGTTAIPDRVPPVRDGERIGGGAGTLQKQATEPFAAFAAGRLATRSMFPYRRGIAPNVRGNLVHASLQSLYADKPDRDAIRDWDAAERARRIEAAVDRAFARLHRHADPALRAILAVERTRTQRLLDTVIEIDSSRTPFRIDAVENRIDATVGILLLSLRADRIDRLPDGSVAIIDYKTGQTRKLLKNHEPSDVQLVVYACAIRDDIGGLALFNVETRSSGIDGTGPAFAAAETFAEDLARWQQAVLQHAAALAAGDVRINTRQGLRASRPLAVLSRRAEVMRDDDG